MDYMGKSTKLCLSYLEDTHADQTRTNHSSGLIFQQYQKKKKNEKQKKRLKIIKKNKKKSKTQVNKLKKITKIKKSKNGVKSRNYLEKGGKNNHKQQQELKRSTVLLSKSKSLKLIKTRTHGYIKMKEEA